MRKPNISLGISILTIAAMAIMLVAFQMSDIRIEDVLAGYQDETEYG